MEDYIFIIIAIILSALGAINRKKKKRIAMMEEEENGGVHEPSFFEEQFVDPFFEEEKPKPEPVFREPITPEPQPVVGPKPASTFKPVSGIELGKDQTERVEEEPEVINETALEGIMKDFSLKKAVIYTEILQRKY